MMLCTARCEVPKPYIGAVSCRASTCEPSSERMHHSSRLPASICCDSLSTEEPPGVRGECGDGIAVAKGTELKLSARQMTAAARRAEKDEKKARNQIKTAIQKSNTEGARICGCAYRGVFASLSRATA